MTILHLPIAGNLEHHADCKGTGEGCNLDAGRLAYSLF